MRSLTATTSWTVRCAGRSAKRIGQTWFRCGVASTAPAGPLSDTRARRLAARAFTLTEMLAVTVIIVLLASILVGVAGYAKNKAAISKAKAEIATLESACEAFKLDQGRYPTSTIYRTIGPCYDYWGSFWEMWNASTLGQQLVPGGYANPTMGGLTIRTNGVLSAIEACSPQVNVGWVAGTNLPNVVIDPWERPYNYMCTYPRLAASLNATMAMNCTYPICTNPGVTNLTTSTYSYCVLTGGQKNVSFDLWSYGPNRANDEGQNDDIANFQ